MVEGLGQEGNEQDPDEEEKQPGDNLTNPYVIDKDSDEEEEVAEDPKS